MSLILHKGAELIEYDALKALPMPEPTATHIPIEHSFVVDIVCHMLQFHSHQVTERHLAVTPDGNEFFAVLTLKSDYGDYVDQVGLRNSHSKKFSLGIAFGSRVTVCDNLAFLSSQVAQRKHTKKVRHELPMLISQMVEPLQLERERQHRVISRYKETPIGQQLFDHALMELYRQGVLNVTKIADVHEQWEHPAHDWGEKTAWRLFNATTYSLTGKVAAEPHLTTTLHKVMDDIVSL